MRPGLILLLLAGGGLLAGRLSGDSSVPNATNQISKISLLEAVRLTLENDPVLAVEKQNVEISRGQAQVATGQFDTTLNATLTRTLDNSALPADSTLNAFSRLTTDQADYRVGATKQFRSGVTINPGVELTRTDDNVTGPALNRASVNFFIQVPLARGLGERVTGAAERAAKINLEAAGLAYQHRVSERVLNTAQAYWTYASAVQQLAIQSATESRARVFVDQMQALVKADELPKSELDKVAANLASDTASRIAAEQALIETRHALGIAIGLAGDRIAALPPPANEFPALAGNELSEQLSLPALLAEALQRRADLAAAIRARDATKALQISAKDGLKPRVDLGLKVGYAGVDGGSHAADLFRPFGENVEGVNALGVLTFEFPPANNVARGQLRQADAAVEQARIRADDLARNIRSNVLLGMERLRHGALQVRQAEEADRLYQTAVVNEREKLNLGMATVLDILQLEDRLTAAALGSLQARFGYALALVQLRFETGTLTTTGQNHGAVSWENLTTVPSLPK